MACIVWIYGKENFRVDSKKSYYNDLWAPSSKRKLTHSVKKKFDFVPNICVNHRENLDAVPTVMWEIFDFYD